MLCHPEPHPAVSYALRNAKSRFDVESAELGGGRAVAGQSQTNLPMSRAEAIHYC